jgi:alcohol dehydrogenase class IV
MAPVFAHTIDNLMEQPENPAIPKLVIVSKVFADFKYKQEKEYLQAFKEKLLHITSLLELPRLSEYGFTEELIPKIIEHTSHKSHPVKLTEAQLEDTLKSRI